MEQKYSWNVLERKVPPLRRQINTSMIGEQIPDLLVFKPKWMPEPDSEAQDNLNIYSQTKIFETIDGKFQCHHKCENDKPHDDGSMTYSESSDFSKFDVFQYNGYREIDYKNGDSYKGLIREGKRFIGTLTFANGGDLLED